ncbi:hypothetical protein BKA62DRAFT_326159 [Auriculariales sp. MPI-PUGE-AT-0066]|nr:hypothetical protein BKA62DRAFT_326159 [Auriculariales sp. MPI-PUGE-AT-0066]
MIKVSGSGSTSSGGRRKGTNASQDSHRNVMRQDSSGMQVDLPPQQRSHQSHSGFPQPLQTGSHVSYDNSVSGSTSSPSVSVGTQFFSAGPSSAPIIESPPPQWNPYPQQQMHPHGAQPLQMPMGTGSTGIPPFTSSLVPSGYGDTLQFTNPNNWGGNSNIGMYATDSMNMGVFGPSGPATGASGGSFDWNPQVYAGPGLSNDWVTSDSLLMPGWHLQDQHGVFQSTMFNMNGPPIPINGHAMPGSSQQQQQQQQQPQQQSMSYGMSTGFS